MSAKYEAQQVGKLWPDNPTLTAWATPALLAVLGNSL
jgi:hypothetical protein